MAEPLWAMYRNHTDKSGADNRPVLLMIKCLMLKKWFNLSDPMLEEMFNDRISFKRFTGLRMEQKAPDETTFVAFRKRLRKSGHIPTLFDTTIKILTSRGIILEKGCLAKKTWNVTTENSR